MSIFDKASMVLLAAGAAGKGGDGNGTVYSIKPTNGDGDLNLNRGADLAATRVAKDGTIEKGRENLITYSNDFTQWGRNADVYATPTTGHLGYDGTNNAWLIDRIDTTNSYIGIPNYLTFSYSGVFTWSIYAKNESSTDNGFLMYTEVGQARFDLTGDGAVLNDSDGTGTLIHSNIEKIGSDGWFRCSFTASGTINANSNGRPRFRIEDLSNNGAVGKIYVQDSQLEVGLVATGYINSGASTGKSGLIVDEPRFDYKGGGCPKLLIEPQSQNLAHKSEYMGGYTFTNCYSTVSHNHGISPEGIKNSTLFSATAETADVGHRLRGPNNFTAEVGETYTVSVFAKKGTKRYFAMTLREQNQATHGHTDVIFDLEDGSVSGTNSSTGSTEDYGNGWFRCIITVSLTNTADIDARPYLFIAQSSSVISYANSTTNDNIELYGLQIEDRSSVTSYIPSHGVAAVTRDADVITNVAIPEVNDDEYTFFVHDVNGLEENANRGPRLSDQTSGAGHNSLMGYYVQNGAKNFFCYTDTGSSVKAFPNVSKTDVDAKYAFVIDNVNLRARGFLNGDLIGDGTPAVTTEPTHLTIASSAGDPNEIHQIMYFPMALSSTEVKILTGATNYASFGAMTDALTNYTTYE